MTLFVIGDYYQAGSMNIDVASQLRTAGFSHMEVSSPTTNNHWRDMRVEATK